MSAILEKVVYRNEDGWVNGVSYSLKDEDGNLIDSWEVVDCNSLFCQPEDMNFSSELSPFLEIDSIVKKCSELGEVELKTTYKSDRELM